MLGIFLNKPGEGMLNYKHTFLNSFKLKENIQKKLKLYNNQSTYSATA